ncbi:hypothetical protein K466DRAFT_597695 [Polyporus arcularius HHB13444]|uniref:Uncharacterized protein n=1 Tax=Polyporus arcularius HHB13444 TaxID=1314778 RepID=A0A5C3PIB3_9APHY|nr:hypothetical protein K466DRAFT_597695 [Polyporus arcularius HHB13444]
MDTGSEIQSALTSLPLIILNKVRQVAAANAVAENWVWPADRREQWRPAQLAWHSFADRWREASDEMLFNTHDAHGSRVLAFCDPVEGGEHINAPMNEILVRDCFLEGVRLLWCNAACDHEGGVVVAGPEGIGKTVFIWFFLVCLLQMKQPVLFKPYNDGPVFLFHPDGSVHTASTARGCLPVAVKSRSEDDLFIWSVCDAGPNPVEGMTGRRVFPVRVLPTSSNQLPTWNLPLWESEELICGARFDRVFPWLQADLAPVITTWCQKPPPDYQEFEDRYPGLLSLLQNHANGGPQSVDEAHKTILGVLIEECGQIPRDVYRGMRNYTGVLREREWSARIEHERLRNAVPH